MDTKYSAAAACHHEVFIFMMLLGNFSLTWIYLVILYSSVLLNKYIKSKNILRFIFELVLSIIISVYAIFDKVLKICTS